MSWSPSPKSADHVCRIVGFALLAALGGLFTA